MVPTQAAHLFSGSFLAFLGGSLGAHHVLCIQSTLSTSQALETLEFSQEQAQSNPKRSRKQGSVLGLGIIPMVTSEEGV